MVKRSRLFVIGAAAAAVAASAAPLPLPYWDQPFLDPLVYQGGASVLSNFTTWTRLYYATPAVGTYAMSPMLSFLNGIFVASWKLSPQDEDQAGQKVMYSLSFDNGVTWTPGSADGANVLFPSMNATENPGVALFAEPCLYIGGRIYAAASPKQFCLYPDQYIDVLLLRRVFDDGTLGPLFWAAPSVPAGFAEASARENVTALPDQDAQTRADIATLTPDASVLPCPPEVNTTKCEAVVGGAQPWPVALNVSSLENERSHYRVPGTEVDVLTYRSHNRVLYAAVRSAPGENFSIPLPTNITDTVSNHNVVKLPSGRVGLISNALIDFERDPLFLSTSADGWAFDTTAIIGTCENSTVFANPPEQPWGCLYRNNGGAKEGGLQYPQGVAVLQPPEAAGLWVIVSVNKEDIWVAHVPLDALP